PSLRAVFYLPIYTPISGFFSIFNNDFLYGVPLVLAALVLIGYALRERMPSFAMYAGAFINLTVTVALLLAVASGQGLMDRVVLVRLIQLNAITLAVYLLPWLSTRKRWQHALDQRRQRVADILLKLQLWLGSSLNAALILTAFCSVVLDTDHLRIGTFAIGSSLGWLSLLAITIATVWMGITRTIRLSPWALGSLLVAISGLIGIDFAAIDGWAGEHVLTLCILGSAWLMFATAEVTRNRWTAMSRDVSAVLGSVTVLLSLRGFRDGGDFSDWWSIGPMFAITALAVALNLRTTVRDYI